MNGQAIHASNPNTAHALCARFARRPRISSDRAQVTCQRCIARLQPQVDIRVENHGSIVILRSTSEQGYAWIEENCSSEGYQPLGQGSRVCEPRYVADIIAGAREAGLEVR